MAASTLRAGRSRLRLAWRYGVGLWALRPSDVLLTAFPRSGSTWLRLLLANVISLTFEEGRAVDLARVNQVMPELGFSDLRGAWPWPGIPRVVKTHRPATWLFGRQRALLLLRHPLDVMVSAHAYAAGRRRAAFAGPPGDFLRHPRLGLPAWFRHTISWLERCDLVVRYEDLRAADRETLAAVLQFLGGPVDAGTIAEAARRSELATARALEDTVGLGMPSPLRPGERFVRTGLVGGWRATCSRDDVDYYRALCRRHALDAYVTSAAGIGGACGGGVAAGDAGRVIG